MHVESEELKKLSTIIVAYAIFIFSSYPYNFLKTLDLNIFMLLCSKQINKKQNILNVHE